MKLVKRILLALLIIFIGIQFIQPSRNQSAQGVHPEFFTANATPEGAYTLFKNACFDCHSNNTSYPWYFSVQPVGWVLASDITDGKQKLNFSELESLSPRRQISKLQNIKNRIEDGTMPLSAYQFMHPDARLTEEQRRMLIKWIEETKDSIGSRR